MKEIYTERGEPFTESTIQLSGVEYQIKVRYSQREGRYYMSLYTADTVPIVLGVKIVCGFSLVRSNPENGPPGRFVAVSNESADDSPPGLNELGSKGSGARVQLLYIEPGDTL